MTPNQPIANPLTHANDFGFVPKMRLAGLPIEESPILLFPGRHAGPNRGHGAIHIWEQHKSELIRFGIVSLDEVPRFLATILTDRTPLFFEGGSLRRTTLLAVRSRVGTAILELRQRNEGNIWSVVTAFAGTKTHGTLVGTVRLK
jgi:hypothetical protein